VYAIFQRYRWWIAICALGTLLVGRSLLSAPSVARHSDASDVSNAEDRVSHAEDGADKEARTRFRHLKPWQPFRAKWASEALVIIETTYSRDASMCGQDPLNGNFEKKTVLKGEIRPKSFKAIFSGVPNDGLPSFFAEGRCYLFFLRAPTKSLGSFEYVGPQEIVAVVDLSQSESEVAALKVRATRSQRHGGFEFTPSKWQEFRDTRMGTDASDCKEFQGFIEGVVARPCADLARVRSYLGEPDDWAANRQGFIYTCYLNHDPRAKPGDLAGWIIMAFSPDRRLEYYRIR